MSNIYLDEIKRNLPRFLALFDIDETSETYGEGDRNRWAWGLIDFSNMGYQGAVNPLSLIWVNGLWPYNTSINVFLKRIDSLFTAIERSVHSDGSIDQAFPYESSYALTGFIANDLASCILNLVNIAPFELIDRWKFITSKLINFLLFGKETHGVISNHLAGVACALIKWHKISDDVFAEKKSIEVINKIIQHSSQEGWFLEYEGFDPGYQTLCLHYLTEIHDIRPDLNLYSTITNSIKFICNFAHPDGSFGGLYGSRCTRFYYPSGILSFANQLPEAKSLSDNMENSIRNSNVVGLSSIDERNIVLMFGSYARSAIIKKTQDDLCVPRCDPIITTNIPCKSDGIFRHYYNQAGLLIDKGADHYTIISTKKGGVIYHYTKDTQSILNAGVVIKNKRNQFFSTQAFNEYNRVLIENNTISITARFTMMRKRQPSILDFIILRFLCITLFKIPCLRELVKRRLVSLLITKKSYLNVSNVRNINLGQHLTSVDEFIGSQNGIKKFDSKYFVAIHMASQGYWQIQDES